MSYIGSSASPLPVNFSAVQSQGFNGTGSQTTFTLNRSVGSVASVEVLVNNVQQSPYDGSYSITSGTSLVFSEAPSAGTNNVYVVYRDQALGSLVDTTAYRKAEVDSAVAAKVSKTGDTMTGRLTISAGADRSIDLLNSSGVAQGYIGVEGAFGGVPSNALRLRGEGGVVLGANGTAHLTCDSSGRVTMPYQPAFRARLTTQPSHSGISVIGGTWTTSVNVGGYYNASTSRFTAPVTGAYQFNAVVATTGGIGYFNYLSAELWVNGARALSGGWDGGGQSYGQTSNSGVLYLQAGDYVQLACESSKAFTVEAGDATSFSGFLIG